MRQPLQLSSSGQTTSEETTDRERNLMVGEESVSETF